MVKKTEHSGFQIALSKQIIGNWIAYQLSWSLTGKLSPLLVVLLLIHSFTYCALDMKARKQTCLVSWHVHHLQSYALSAAHEYSARRPRFGEYLSR